ncbi:CUB domain [Trinorchestia longiramus]|nr:CUB domain [Trinorchestia longiramus]
MQPVQLCILAACAVLSCAASVTPLDASHDVAQTAVAIEPDSDLVVPAHNRSSKLFPVVTIITFDNGPCEAVNGLHGTCYSEKECDELGGIKSGSCAGTYGVCCVMKSSCGQTISYNNTYWSSPGYPSSYSSPGMCMSEIHPPPGTCQILLHFMAFDLVGPVAGDCNNDTFNFVGGNPGVEIPVLCGHNSGQHYYVDVDNAMSPFKLITTLSSVGAARFWNIKVTFILRDDPLKAPFRCLQYHRTSSGSLSSFNFRGNSPQMLNNLNYAICFACIPGFCDVGISFNTFDLGNINGQCAADYIAAGPEKFCGEFTSLAIQVNATGPLVVWIGSDSNNDNLENGFSGSYLMLAC